mgnify:CR=1 FL=1
MKKFILILIVFIGIILFFQCQKKDAVLQDSHQTNPVVETRSTGNYSKVVAPDCGLIDFFPNLSYHSSITIYDTLYPYQNCPFAVEIDVIIYINSTGRYFDYGEFRWKPLRPWDPACEQWYQDNFSSTYIGDNRTFYYEFVDDLRWELIDNYMVDYIYDLNLPCGESFRVAAYVYKSPCTQLCHKTIQTKDGLDFVITEKPCADDGCCLEWVDYCLNIVGEPIISRYVQPISSCSNYIIGDCEGGNTVGGCTEKGCL